MAQAIVDLFCNQLEVGTSIAMSEVGPTCAYIEHEKPLPVGAVLRVHTDAGSEIGAVVVRVHEATSNADRAPGMYIRVVEISDEAEAWWKSHVDGRQDPVFPESPVGGMANPLSTARTNTLNISADELARMAAADKTEANAAAPAFGEMPGQEASEDGAGSIPQSPAALAAAAEGKKKTAKSVNTTVKMTADQVKAITDLAPPEKQNGSSGAVAVSAPPPEVAAAENAPENAKSKKKKKRGKKKKR